MHADSIHSHLDALREKSTKGRRELELANKNLFFENKQTNKRKNEQKQKDKKLYNGLV